MQSTTDAERAMILAPDTQMQCGLDLLDDANQVVDDITDAFVLEDSEIEYQCDATVPRTCTLNIDAELDWGHARVRPWVTYSAGEETTRRFYGGVFGLTTPERKPGQPFTVDGYDLLQLLSTNYPGDTRVAAAATSYVEQARSVITDSQVGATLQVDGTLQNTLIPAPGMVWALPPSDQQASWLRMANDLFEAINYQGMYANEIGVLRSGPYVLPRLRSEEWVFDLTDPATDIVVPGWSEQQDLFAPYNWWKYVASSWPTQQVIDDGIYLPARNADPAHPESTALGRISRKPVQFFDAADQDSLVAQGDRDVATDLTLRHTFTLQVDRLILGGHRDVVGLIVPGDAGPRSLKCQVSSWSFRFDGQPSDWEMGVIVDG